MPEDKKIREMISNICKMIYSKNMVSGSGGNISIRKGNSVFITPSGYSLGGIEIDDIVEVAIDGEKKSSLRPSKELLLHIEAYRARPDITSLVHIHSHYSILVGILFEENNMKLPMPPYTPGYAIRIKSMGFIPFYPPGSEELARGVGKEIKKSNVILMKNHGMVVAGRDIQEAFNIAEEVEENAKIHFTLKGNGALTDDQVKAILDKYR